MMRLVAALLLQARGSWYRCLRGVARHGNVCIDRHRISTSSQLLLPELFASLDDEEILEDLDYNADLYVFNQDNALD